MAFPPGLGKGSVAALKPSRTKLLTGLLIAAFVGALVGATAIGAGIIAIPTLLFFFGSPPSQAVGTCVLIGLALTLVSTVVYGQGGSVDAWTALLTSAGSLVGVYYGSRLSVQVSERGLKGALVAVIIISSVVMLQK